MSAIRKKDMKWLTHIGIMSTSGKGDSIQHLPVGPLNRLAKAGLIVIRSPRNPANYDRAFVTQAGTETLSVSGGDK